MTTGITLSASVRNNLLSLQSTAKMMSETQNRLATGNKVNSAVDNATSFFTAAGLTNRASDLSGLQDDMGLATKTVQAASTGIDGISKLVTQAKSIVNQAKQIKGEVTEATFTGTKTGLTGSTSLGGVASDSLIIGTTTIDLSTAKTIDEIATAVKADNADYTVGLTDDGKINVTDASGGAVNVAVVGAALATASGISATPAAMTGGKTAAADKTEKLADFVTQYNDLRDQIDQIAADSSFNGVNLLDSQNLTVNFNASGSSSLALKGVDMTSGGSKLNIASVDATTLTDGTASTALGSATTALRTQASTFGSNLAVIQNRQDFTQATIDNLGAGAGDLTLADTNQEGANLLALQTRQSLATTALSLSNQAQSSILSILR